MEQCGKKDDAQQPANAIGKGVHIILATAFGLKPLETAVIHAQCTNKIELVDCKCLDLLRNRAPLW